MSETIDAFKAEAILAIMKERFDFVNPEEHSFKPFHINDLHLGYLNPQFEALVKRDLADRVEERDGKIFMTSESWLATGDILQHTAQTWHNAGVFHGWRNEKFMVRDKEGKPLFALERSAFRPLGFLSEAVHINGIVKPTKDFAGHRFWIGKRSPFKAVDPNKLDNLVGGGVAYDETVQDALFREGFEEAGLPEEVLEGLKPNRVVMSRRPVKRGLHREHLHIYDLYMDESLIPENQDGEVASFELMDLDTVARLMEAGEFMNDAAISLLGTFRDLGFISKGSGLESWLEERLVKNEN